MKPLSPLAKLALAVAGSFLGVKEVPPGSNRGPQVNQFLASVGLSGGYPWCAAFVYFCIQSAASKLSLANPFVRSGGCIVFERFARSKGILKTEPQAGDVFLCYGSPEGYRRASHTGLVLSVNEAKQTFTTIEGNTNLDGSREGIGVFKRVRPMSDRYAFIRYNDLVKAAAVAKQPPAPKIARTFGQSYKVFLNDTLIFEAPTVDGRTWMPLKTWCGALGLPFGFDVEHQVVTIQGREAPLDLCVTMQENGLTLPTAPVRQLVRFSGLKMRVDTAKGEIHVSR